MKTDKLFTSDEKKALTDAEFFRTKKNVFEKIAGQMALLQNNTAELIKNNSALASEVKLQQAKITRGENLGGLPFMVLDYPRYFNGENIFAFRTLFWWGKFVSYNMHLGGIYCKQFSKAVTSNLKKKTQPNTWWYHNDHPWKHDFIDENYVAATKKNLQQIENTERTFLKISRKLELSQVEKFVPEGEKAFADFLNLLG